MKCSQIDESVQSTISSLVSSLEELIPSCHYSSYDIVILSWEIALQRLSCIEDIGIKFLTNLLYSVPEMRPMFGFRQHQDLTRNRLAQFGLLVHARVLVEMLSDLILNIDIDFDGSHWMFNALAKHLIKWDISITCIIDVVAVVKETLKDTFGNNWNKQYEDSWNEFLTTIAAMTVQLMVKRS
jgi:hypothetical protein